MSERREDDAARSRLPRADLTDAEYDRFVAELRADPALLREALRPTREDADASASLLLGESGTEEQARLDESFRRYLLADPSLPPEEAARLEELLVEDERYLERLTLAEHELMEEYLRGTLTDAEGERFRSHFLVTPERRETLRMLRELAASAPSAAAENPPSVVKPSSPVAVGGWWQSLVALRPPGVWAGAAAAMLIACLLLAALWFTRRGGREGPTIARRPETPPTHATATPTPAGGADDVVPPSPLPSPTPPTPEASPRPSRTPSPSPRDTPPRDLPPTLARPTVFALIPGALRGGGAGQRIEPGTRAAELRLRLDVEEKYESFNVVVLSSGGREVASRVRLRATNRDGLPTVVLSLPASSLNPDDYQVVLSGNAGGARREVARYSFRVLR
jgi:hypothetical protein